MAGIIFLVNQKRNLNVSLNNAHIHLTARRITFLCDGIMEYMMHTETYPVSIDDLVDHMAAGGYDIVDGWGRNLNINAIGDYKLQVSSSGKDGLLGGDAALDDWIILISFNNQEPTMLRGIDVIVKAIPEYAREPMKRDIDDWRLTAARRGQEIRVRWTPELMPSESPSGGSGQDPNTPLQ
jgi:hypothetical protein